MKFDELYVTEFENTDDRPTCVNGIMRIDPGGRIYKSTIRGPLYVARNSQIGFHADIGRYFGINADGYCARATVGAFCAIGARTAINPFNHPMDWLSIHEFQYQPKSFDWVEEYRDLERHERSRDMYERVTIGNDVWMGHNVNVMAGVTVRDGAVIAAGSVVTKDVPPYAVVAGVPAQVKKYRFKDETIERLLRLKWWDLELSQLSGLPFKDIDRCLDRIEEIRA